MDLPLLPSYVHVYMYAQVVVVRVLIAWLVAALSGKVGWRCVMEDCGALSVIVAGLMCVPILCADHWAFRAPKREVKPSYTTYVPV